MPAIPLGFKPLAIKPIFSKGQDWIVTIKPVSATPFEWPDGTVITAHVYPPGQDIRKPLAEWDELFAWQAIIGEDQSLTFKADSADTDQVPAASLMRIRASMPNTPSSDDYTYFKGQVVRDD